MADPLELIVKAGEQEGASLSALVDALGALNRLFLAVASAEIRPGAGRVKLSEKVEPLLDLRIRSAAPKSSLNVELLPPTLPKLYHGDFPNLPDIVNQRVHRTFVAISKSDQASLISLFPEKADQFRVLRAVEDLAPRGLDHGIAINGIRGLQAPLRFTESTRDWAIKTRPMTAPQSAVIRGVVRSGHLDERSQFKVSDGERLIRVATHGENNSQLRDYLGRPVEITGTAFYGKGGEIARLEQVTSIKPLVFKMKQVEHKSILYTLKHPLEFKVLSSDTTKTFYFENELLGIYCHSRSLKRCAEEAAADFNNLWVEMTTSAVGDLHSSAVKMRDFLLGLVDTVEDFSPIDDNQINP